MTAGRQGLRRRSTAPLLRSISNAARHPAALNETQAQAWLTQVVRSAQIPTAQHHRAHVRLAEGKSSHRYALRQARNTFCGDGLIGLCHEVFATILFVQNLRLPNGESATVNVGCSRPQRLPAAEPALHRRSPAMNHCRAVSDCWNDQYP